MLLCSDIKKYKSKFQFSYQIKRLTLIRPEKKRPDITVIYAYKTSKNRQLTNIFASKNKIILNVVINVERENFYVLALEV